MDSIKNSIEFERDSKGIDGNGDGHLHLRKDVDGHLHIKQIADGHPHLRRGMATATHTLGKLWMERWGWPPPH